MYRRYFSTGMLAAIIFLGGCAAKPIAVSSCPEVDTQVAPERPPEGGARKVMLLGFNDEKARTGDAGITGLIESRTSNLVGKSGAEVLDPSLAEDLSEQIRRYEIRGESNYTSNLATDAIKGEIISAQLTYSFKEKKQIETDEGTEWQPAKCRFNATISGTLNLYSVNPLQLVHTVPISGKSSQTIEMEDKTCPLPAGQDTELYRQAALNAAKEKNYKEGIYEHFRQVGHVKEVRMCMEDDKSNFVWLSTSPDQGATTNSDVGIYRQYWYEDKLEGTRMLRKKQVASGKIVLTNNSDEAWVQIKDREAAKAVMLGDLTEITHSDCDKAYEWMCGF